MEDIAGKPGFFERLFGLVHRREVEEIEEERVTLPTTHVRVGANQTHHCTVRRHITSFQDAVAAADGLKQGDTQVINISMAPPEIREKIKDFMCGVNYSAEGSWEEIGDNVFLLAPSTVYVEVAPSASAPSTGRFNAFT